MSYMIIVFTGDGKGKTTASLGQAVRSIGRGKKVLMIQFIKGPWKSGEDFVEICPMASSTESQQTHSTDSTSPSAVSSSVLSSGSKDSGPNGSPQASSGSSAFKLVKMGLGFVGILGDKLPKDDHAKAAKLALQYFVEELPKWDMVILDEVNVAVSLGLLSAAEVMETLKGFPREKIVILTGRGAPQEFIDAADLVTEMKEIKHPYNYGELAELGVEF